MKRNILQFGLMSICAMAAVSGCKNAPKDPDSDNAMKWNAEQRATIESIRPVEGSDGHLFEIDYTADYKLAECVAENCANTTATLVALYKNLLPESRMLLGTVRTDGVACSTFSAPSSDGGFVLGRNYDFPVGGNYYMVVHTNPAKGYKSVGVADMSVLLANPDPADPFSTVRNKEIALFSPYCILDGINEKGFMCSFMELEYESVKQDRGKTKLVTNWTLRLMLDNCATVAEAIELMDQYDMQSVFMDRDADLHFILADAQGDRAVIEYVENEMKVLRTPDLIGEAGEFVLSTNFYLTPGRRVDRETGLWKLKELGYWRFDTLLARLRENPNPSREESMENMRSVRIQFNDEDEKENIRRVGKNPEELDSWVWMTLWSAVYSTQDLSLDLCIRENYDQKFHFGLGMEK